MSLLCLFGARFSNTRQNTRITNIKRMWQTYLTRLLLVNKRRIHIWLLITRGVRRRLHAADFRCRRHEPVDVSLHRRVPVLAVGSLGLRLVLGCRGCCCCCGSGLATLRQRRVRLRLRREALSALVWLGSVRLLGASDLRRREAHALLAFRFWFRLGCRCRLGEGVGGVLLILMRRLGNNFGRCVCPRRRPRPRATALPG